MCNETIRADERTQPHHFGKRAINVILSADVPDAAREMNINISKLYDAYLREVIRKEQERRWRNDHTDFVSAYNATIETEGLPLEEWRSF